LLFLSAIITNLFILTITNDIRLFISVTFFIGLCTGVWFLSDYEMLREDKYYILCLIIGIAYLGYGLALNDHFATGNYSLLDSGSLYPLTLLVIQWPARRLYLVIFNREPKVENGGKFWDIVYSIILFIGLAVLPFLIMEFVY